jgi:hypothetical protein
MSTKTVLALGLTLVIILLCSAIISGSLSNKKKESRPNFVAHVINHLSKNW